MTPLRIGLIGAGKHGARYARHISQDLGDVARIVALARRDRAKAAAQAAELGCRACGDYRELVAAADVDAVIVVVPPTLHPEICAAIAAERKPALFEKPAAASLAGARQMLAWAGSHLDRLMVAQTLRYNAVVRAVCGALGGIGPVHALRLSQRFEPSPLGWLDVPEVSGGGMILHTGVHSFDLVRLFTGLEVESVSCETAQVATRRTEDNWAASLRLRGDVLASVAGSRATRSRTGPIEIVGSGGLLWGDHVHGTLAKVTGTTIETVTVGPPAATVLEAARDFIAAVRGDRPMPIPLIEGLRAVAVVDACYRAAREGRRVEPERL